MDGDDFEREALTFTEAADALAKLRGVTVELPPELLATDLLHLLVYINNVIERGPAHPDRITVHGVETLPDETIRVDASVRWVTGTEPTGDPGGAP